MNEKFFELKRDIIIGIVHVEKAQETSSDSDMHVVRVQVRLPQRDLLNNYSRTEFDNRRQTHRLQK